ncbi:uncharacterized protein LOC127356337 isoform X9 [Dicentrarchus labrax]|uniref:Endonuclease/exonuclease/phosphatase domain-containing protein n=1 Tax=Dicentrarchus labrax TaxID=13489 RepID=A0A8P4G2B0_DICLA|nr:uncharacterized protein LOC127356337 isoform X9 [Dicentrarchus labrax]XP_051243967.1 uncharacterized protein LOC127356337 isoform X9 [Dicentrarchus labrax]XP_051243968.1 uncharacterized protein LOC127356337 isoform X9 [Dicentrarchus labrax]
MATADQLLKQLFSWIELKELFAENLRTLALEMELEPPGTKRKMRNVLARFSSKITEVKQAIEKKSHKIETRIQKLFERLKTESSSTDPDEVDRHIMAEVVRAMARRSEVEEQIIMLNRVPPSKTGLLKRYKFVGGAVGLLFELPEEIDYWTDLIERNRVTEAIKSLRDTADAILKICPKLKEHFDIRKIIEEVDKSQREHEENKSSNPAQDQSGNQQTSVESQTDQRHEDEQEGGTGSDQQGGGDQEDKETDSDDKHRDPVYELSEDHFDIIIYIITKLHFENIQRPPGTIKVALLNVRSMNKKGGPEKILKLITKNNLDVLLTTETWLKNNNAGKVLTKASPPNYTSHYQVRVGQRGGGVAIQFSQELQGKKNPFDSITTFECVVTVLHHDEWNQPVPFINVYHPPRYNRATFKTFLNEFQKVLAHLKEKYNSIVVTGDFNIRVKKTTNSFTDEFYNILLIYDLKQHVRGPTHQAGNTLDLVLTRNVEISDLVVWNDRISDHYTVYFIARPEGGN